MNRKQEEGRLPSRTSERTPVQVYLDVDQWERFAAVSEAQHRSRSAQIRELIRRDIEQHDQAIAA